MATQSGSYAKAQISNMAWPTHQRGLAVYVVIYCHPCQGEDSSGLIGNLSPCCLNDHDVNCQLGGRAELNPWTGGLCPICRQPWIYSAGEYRRAESKGHETQDKNKLTTFSTNWQLWTNHTGSECPPCTSKVVLQIIRKSTVPDSIILKTTNIC